MKIRILLIATMTVGLLNGGCNKEAPLETSAAFTTNIQNNTLAASQGFTVYLDQAEGEFLTYFKGDKEETSYGTGYGRTIEAGTDSLVLSAYGTPGTYTFTLVARSFGDWGSTISEDVQSININVVAEE
jgi:hypothetical protein